MFRGLATISFYAEDHAAAKEWYATLLGAAPYFDMPGYFEFRIGDQQDELGVIDAAYAPPGAVDGPAGAVVYWHVDDLDDTLTTLRSMGATEYQPVTERGQGFTTAAVVDPFGNILGVMTNPHYVEMTSETRATDRT